MRIGTQMPGFRGATGWINVSLPCDDRIASGTPTLVHFWDTSCCRCQENLPTIQAWKAAYGGPGGLLRVIAVYMPPGNSGENAVEEARAAAARLGITEVCAIDDGEGVIRSAFGNEEKLVPAYFLFDSAGRLRNRSGGDAGLAMLESTLQRLMETSQAEKRGRSSRP